MLNTVKVFLSCIFHLQDLNLQLSQSRRKNVTSIIEYMNMRSIVWVTGLLSIMACSSVDTSDHAIESVDNMPLFRKALSEYTPFFQKVIGKDTGDFRGVMRGMSMAQVRAIEEAHHEETDSLTVRYDFEDGIDKNVEIEYVFTKDSLLLQMDMTIYFAKVSARDTVFEDLRKYYSEREKIVGVASNFYWEGHQSKVIVEKGGIPDFPEIAIRFD